MARRRFQNGSLELRGNSWTSRWTERVIVNGEMVERHPSRVLGTKKDYPTRKLRAHSDWIDSLGINNLSYRPKPVASFSEFAEKWKKSVLPNLKPSTQPPIRSQLRKHLVPRLGGVAMKDISGEMLQSFVTDCSKLSPKSVKNLVATLSVMWNQAKAWGYTDRDPFATLVLPEWEEAEQPSFSVDEIRRIIQAAKPPYDTVFWLVAQTGIRRGEGAAASHRAAVHRCKFRLISRAHP
jgi:integrase